MSRTPEFPTGAADRAAAPFIALLATLCTTAIPVAAQTDSLEDEIDFVRGIVEDLRFVELAVHEVKDLRKRFDAPDERKLIDQLAVEVSIQGARSHPDRPTRRKLFKEALEQSTRLIQRYEGEPVAHDARRTLVESCIEFGRFLNEELELLREENAASDAIAQVEAAAAEVFRQGVDATRKVQEHWADEDGDIKSFVAWMQRGILLREHARAVPKDRKYLAGEAVATLEELVFEVGEETLLGQRAYFEMAGVSEVLGDNETAIRNYTDTIAAVWTALTGESADLIPEDVQRMMFEMMQEVYDRLATVCFRVGDHERVHAIVAECKERIAEFRTEPHHVFGDSLLLTKARVHAVSPRQVDVSEALRIARMINERHATDFVGLRAKNLIRDILRGSAELVTGDLLLEVAKGNYQEKDYEVAIAGFKRALERMDGETRAKHGFETWNLIGRSNERMDRFLEAAMAYSRALEEFADEVTETHEDAEAELERTATRAASCIRRVVRMSGDPEVFRSLKNRIETQLREFDPQQMTLVDYRKGLRLRSERKYGDAAAAFAKVTGDYEKYELALAYRVLCLYYDDRYDEAVQQIAALRKHAAEGELAEDDRARRAYRKQAVAWAHYVEGRIRYARATDAEGEPDVTRFPALIDHFREFELVHSAMASNLMPVVHEILGRLYIGTGDEKNALLRYEKLKVIGETKANAHRTLGLAIIDDYTERIGLLEAEVEALDRAGKDAGATEQKLTALRKAALVLGLDFARTVHPPTYPVLYNMMRIAERLEDWKSCEWSAERILSLYDKSDRSSLDQVRPTLGLALMRQPGRLKEALDVLEEAEKQWTGDPEKPKTSGYYEILRYKALALGGWPAFDENGINYTPNPGLGRPEEAYEILWEGDYRKYALNSRRTPKYSLDWYQYYLEVCYVCRQAMGADSQFGQRATTLFNIARSTDNFATLEALGPRGRRVATLFRFVR